MQVGHPVVTLASLEGSLGSRGAGGFKTGSSSRFIPLFYARTNWISQSKSYLRLKQQSRGGSEPRSEHLLFLPSLPDPGFHGKGERENAEEQQHPGPLGSGLSRHELWHGVGFKRPLRGQGEGWSGTCPGHEALSSDPEMPQAGYGSHF